MQRVVVARLSIVHHLLGHHAVFDEELAAIESDAGVVQVALRSPDVGQGLCHLFRTRPVHRLVELGLQASQLALGLRQLRLIFVVFQADDDLPLLDAVALIHTNPLHPADHFGGHFDFVRRHNVAGGVEDDTLRRAARADRLDALHFH